MKNDELSYSEVMKLASELKVVAGQIDELVLVMKDDYNEIGYDGPMWSGDTASKVKTTFDNTTERVPYFVEQINNYADALVNDLIRNEE